MKIVKKDLLDALNAAKMFTGRKGSFEILHYVLIDGPGGKLVATDNESTCEISLSISDAIREVTKDAPAVVFPDDAFREDLLSLKKPQLESLCEYAGIDCGNSTKAAIVELIFGLSEQSATQEKANQTPEVVEVGERFCVNPNDLLKIVQSLNMKTDELVDLSVDGFELSDGLLESVQAMTMKIGEEFHELRIKPDELFPSTVDHGANLPLLMIKGEELAHVAKVLSASAESLIPQSLFIDGENGNIVGCDIKRLHMLKHKIATGFQVAVPARPAQAVCALSRKENITFAVSQDGIYVSMKFGNVTVTSSAIDVKYPSYMQLFPDDKDHVIVKKESLLNVVKQAGILVKGSEYDGIKLTFNGGINVESSSGKGIFAKENIPFEKGKFGTALETWFRCDFLVDALESADEKVKIVVAGESNPLVVYRGSDFSALVMPMAAPKAA